jgi:ABC-type polysaccharide/polyol phosphate transport system ATPase subunit
MITIELKNVSLDYYIDNEDAYSFKNALLNFYSKVQKPKPKTYRALENISLEISNNEKVGIIGLNGAGKSTLLRVMSRIFEPSKGQVKTYGHISALLDFSSGFDGNLTGLENMKIQLMLLGLTKKQAEDKIPEIVDFSELKDFINQPIRTYSTGMSMRLAFATVTSINPEILIADEVIGTGDLLFAAKAKNRLEKFLSNNCTMILSSHSMDMIKNFCNRAIWLNKGHIMLDGSVDDVIKEYQKLVN